MRALIVLSLPILLLAGCGRAVPGQDAASGRARPEPPRAAGEPVDAAAWQAKLEGRVAALEREVAELRVRLDTRQPLDAEALPGMPPPLAPPMLPPPASPAAADGHAR